MDDRSLYEKLLGVSPPWHVESVVFEESLQEVLVRVELVREARLACPICSRTVATYDTADQRRWRHLDSCGFKTFLVASLPRVECPEHGVRTISVPWSEPKSRFTLSFERWAIGVLKLVKAQSRAARILGLSPGQVHDIMSRAVSRGLKARKRTDMMHLSLDEKSFQSNKRYATVLTDIAGRRILDVCQDRTSDAVATLLTKTLSQSQLKAVKSVTMDMWDGFIKASREVLPKAEIVFDRFHIAKYLNDAVDHTRISEHKKLKQQGDDRLKGSKFFWVSRFDNLREKQLLRYGALKDANLETAKAWALKENFREFFQMEDAAQGNTFFQAWLADVAKTGNVYLTKVAKMLKRYYFGLLNYLTHRQTNSAAEGVNGMIQEIKFCARGFRTFAGFRTAILFHLGKLDLYPLKSP